MSLQHSGNMYIVVHTRPPSAKPGRHHSKVHSSASCATKFTTFVAETTSIGIYNQIKGFCLPCAASPLACVPPRVLWWWAGWARQQVYRTGSGLGSPLLPALVAGRRPVNLAFSQFPPVNAQFHFRMSASITLVFYISWPMEAQEPQEFLKVRKGIFAGFDRSSVFPTLVTRSCFW